MPMKAPRICRCGAVVPSGSRCPCTAGEDAARKARFDLKRPNSSQRGYTGTWDRAADAYLARHRKCKFCRAAATLVDHIKPHRGDMELFWNRDNWQPLCTQCHSGAKQRLERLQPKGT